MQYFGATKNINRGCPQGGVLSDSLWNLGYNPVLKYLEKKLIQFFCYADDTIIMLSAHKAEELIIRITNIINDIEKLMKELGLTLGRKKTVIMFLSKAREYAELNSE